MKRRHNEGFTLLETLIAIVVLGVVVVPVCSSLVMSFRINAKAEQLMRDQLAVSSAVETLMAEGINSADEAMWGESLEEEEDSLATNSYFSGVQVEASRTAGDSYYVVTVTAGEVTVETRIRAIEGSGS